MSEINNFLLIFQSKDDHYAWLVNVFLNLKLHELFV